MSDTSSRAASTAPSPAAVSRAVQRFVFVDALRGLAAAAVVACHLAPQTPVFPSLITQAMHLGERGVQVFFVISGFVIAYSVRQARITPGYLGNFALRRAVRLDPPYWVSIAVVLLLTACGAAATEVTISTPQVLAHLVYAQRFCGFEDLSVVFWTLRMEIAFYLAFIVLLGMAQRLGDALAGRRDSSSAAAWGLTCVFLPVALLSVACFDIPRVPAVFRFFHMFLAGAVLCWVMERKLSSQLWWLLALAMSVQLVRSPDSALLVATVTGTAIFAVERAGRLSSYLAHGPLQYLGKISYSLYLIHAPIINSLLALGPDRSPHSASQALAWIALSVVASLLAADLLYRTAEVPSLRLAKHLSARRTRPTPSLGSFPTAAASAIST